ncbi:nuclear RNA export factor 3-like isoform X1 [Cervus elaphus]|uniref:nuclear RNA export factor 3-like isoform X1 n=1 Tax=Cervus canadensis TaxID=1574408 RepID=UPI0018BB27C7|nr:nuclear RNA export factor 3-like isoform X1 [Cervus canadensis]XP_043753654.1 nuclear RNA export factor 3-like isoform X1 [Cervus elaphus]
MEHTNKVNPLQRRAPSWGVYRRRYTYWSEQVISQQQQDRDSEESDACMDNQARDARCELPSHHWRSSFQKQDQMHIYMETKQKPPEKRMGRNRQDETLGSWFKITIPFGIKYDEKWLLNLIQKQSSVPFIAFEFHYEKMQAQFFVENANIACALKNINGKIFNEVNEKIFILVEPCESPQSVQKVLTSEKVEQIKFSSLDLSNKKPYLLDGLSTIMRNASNAQNLNISNTEVKAEGQMDKGQQLEPEGICADRNAVCTNFPDKSTNIRLLSLDGQETLSGSKCAIEVPKFLSMCKGSFFGFDQVNSQILQFLQEYYLIHDYGDRQGLLDFYHEEACFFLTIPFHPKDSGLSSMRLYFKDNRNTEKLKDPNLRVQMLKHTKHDIVHALCALPKTQHDFSSFMVDMCFQTETMLCFSVSGVFKEVEGSSQGCVHAFTRTFITTPISSSSLCIVNDELFVREASPSEAQRLHSPSQCLHCRPLSCSTSPLSSMKWCGLSPPSVESPLIVSDVTAGFAWSWEGTERSGRIINGNLKKMRSHSEREKETRDRNEEKERHVVEWGSEVQGLIT